MFAALVRGFVVVLVVWLSSGLSQSLHVRLAHCEAETETGHHLCSGHDHAHHHGLAGGDHEPERREEEDTHDCGVCLALAGLVCDGLLFSLVGVEYDAVACDRVWGVDDVPVERGLDLIAARGPPLC